MKGIGWVFGVVCAIMLAGCVSEQVTPEYKPRMGVARSAGGYVNFSIDSREGYEYAIYYEDPVTRDWKLVPGCDRIRGNGGQIELRKKFNSRGELPAFTLRHTKIN